MTLRGAGTDPQDGAWPPRALSWQVVLHHGSHVHLIGDLDGRRSFTARTDHDADSYYEIALTVRDSDGLTGTSARPPSDPRPCRFHHEQPPGATSTGRAATAAPYTATAAIGFKTRSARPSVHQRRQAYVFDHWSDGGARTTR